MVLIIINHPLGKIEIIKCLLNLPVSSELMRSQDNNGETGFMKACKSGFSEIVKLLLEHPIRNELIHTKDQDEKTALIHAKVNGNSHIVKILQKSYSEADSFPNDRRFLI